MMAAIRYRANPPPPKKTKRRFRQKPKHNHAATDPLVNPGNPSYCHQTRSKAYSTRTHHRMVLLAQSPPSCRSTRSLQVKKAVMLGSQIPSAAWLPQRRLNSQGMTVFLRAFLMPMPARSASTSLPKNFAPARVSHRREYSCPCKPRDPPAWSWPSRLSRPPAGPERAGHPELVNRRERPSAVVSNVQVLVGCRQQRSGKKRRQPVRG